jgi:RNA polymerase sigma-70 factor (ECF subfamily)
VVHTDLRDVEETEHTLDACPTVTDQERDRQCAERMRAGDAGALEELYDRHGDLLYSLALRIVGRPAEAEDVVQEAWLQIWNSASRYDSSRGPVAAWLVTVARSRAIDRLRKLGSRSRAETAAGMDPPAPAEDASAGASQGQIRDRVEAALASLPPQIRQVLELAYFGGLSQTEISSRLGAPLGTVKSWTRQGLLRLREQVPQEEWA